MTRAIPCEMRFLAAALAALLAGCAISVAPTGVAASGKPAGAASARPGVKATATPVGPPPVGTCPPGPVPERLEGALVVMVRDEAGRPLAGRDVDVKAQGAPYRLACAPMAPAATSGSGRTDAAGQVKISGLAPGAYVVTDRASKATATVGVSASANTPISLVVPTEPPAGSVPFTPLQVTGVGGRTLGGEGRARWFDDQAAFDEFLAGGGQELQGAPVDFATEHVLAVEVMGNACQGSRVAALTPGPGDGLTVALEPYDQGCMNAIGPTPHLVFLKVARSALAGSPTPVPPGADKLAQTPATPAPGP